MEERLSSHTFPGQLEENRDAIQEESESQIAIPGAWSAGDPVPDAVVRSTRLLREHLLADPHRPRYHFCLPEDMGEPGDPNGAFYYNGRMSWVDNTYFAPEALIDGRGRQIMWAWLTDNPPDGKEQGWSGVYGLPRSLWLGEDGTLRMQPVKELEMLRCGERGWEDVVLGDGENRSLDGVAGDACEIWLEIEMGSAARCGLKVRDSGDGEEETLLYCDCRTRELVFDATRSGEVGRTVVECAPFALAPGEMLTLRIFVDRSVVEVFANDRQAIGRRVYPGREDSLGVALLVDGGTARFKRIRAWKMAPANPY